MKKQITNNEGSSFQPVLRSKCLTILAFLGVLAIMSPSYLSGNDLWIAYILIGFTGLVTFGLRQNIRFQKFHKKLRPFIVVRVLQAIVTLGFLGLIFRTIKVAFVGALIPYLVYYLLAFLAVYQFYSIFRLAKRAKEKFPDRCEFC